MKNLSAAEWRAPWKCVSHEPAEHGDTVLPRSDCTFEWTGLVGDKPSEEWQNYIFELSKMHGCGYRLPGDPPGTVRTAVVDPIKDQGWADDAVDHPSHYTSHPSGVECITVVEHMSFLRGNAIKYLWRAGDKGDELEDLRKARWYIDREITNLEAARGGE